MCQLDEKWGQKVCFILKGKKKIIYVLKQIKFDCLDYIKNIYIFGEWVVFNPRNQKFFKWIICGALMLTFFYCSMESLLNFLNFYLSVTVDVRR